jgi:hypothetical protein
MRTAGTCPPFTRRATVFLDTDRYSASPSRLMRGNTGPSNDTAPGLDRIRGKLRFTSSKVTRRTA